MQFWQQNYRAYRQRSSLRWRGDRIIA